MSDDTNGQTPEEPQEPKPEGADQKAEQKLHINEAWGMDVIAARMKVRKCEDEEAHAHEIYKAKRSAREAATDELLAVIDNATAPSLFNQLNKQGGIGEQWRDVPLSDLGLPEGMMQKLNEAEIETVGDVATFVNDGKRLTDIKGIGEANAEKLENALTEFWAKWNAEHVGDQQKKEDEGDGASVAA